MAEQKLSRRRSGASSLWAALLLYGAVSAGGAFGAILRWAVSLVFENDGFPWATLFANCTGALIIGFFARLTGPDGRVLASPRMRHFVMTGVLGGYTTFSIFSLETFRLAQGGAYGLMFGYVGLSLFAWMAAVWLGDVLARRYTRLRGAPS